jgi:hypothetical protein
MAFINVKHTLANDALYWIGKVYYNLTSYHFYLERHQIVGRQTITPPRTDDWREIEKFNHLISKRVSDFIALVVQQQAEPVKNSTTDWQYWISRRQAWQRGILPRLQQLG